MSKQPDFIKQAITQHLAPVLTNAGFYRYKPKHFVRIRGEIVDSVGFQVSQWGSRDFYVHHYVNLLSDPNMSIDAYSIGDRVDGPPDRDVKWNGADENSASLALQSVTKLVEEEVLPWFESIHSIRDYIVAYVANPNTHLESLELAIALIRTGTTNRAWWICHALAQASHYTQPMEAFEQQQMQLAQQLQEAIESESHGLWLNKWRRDNICKFKLEPLFGK
ncbi:hypothetical protein JCM14076_17540 [Methylosoma difficile]